LLKVKNPQCRASVGGAPSVPIATMFRCQVAAAAAPPSRRVSSTFYCRLVTVLLDQ
jgi:hypothetical protein